MKKETILLMFLTCFSLTVLGQKYVTVSVSTTTPLKEALQICKNVGELGWFYSLDYDENIDSFSMMRHPLTPSTKIDVSAAVTTDKTILLMKLSENKTGVFSKPIKEYMKLLKSYTDALKSRLQNLQVGNYIAVKG